jgi:hypothetical protein
MFFARLPKRSVESVSASLKEEGEQLMMRVVRELPPRLSCSSRVSFESRYGTCVLFPSVSALITLPSVERLLLIIFASSSACPSAPVFCTFSLPARSTRNSLPDRDDPSARFRCCTCSRKIACDRDDSKFIFVGAIARFCRPCGRRVTPMMTTTTTTTTTTKTDHHCRHRRHTLTTAATPY